MFVKKEIVRLRNGNRQELSDDVACEDPVTVIFNGQEIATLLCSPSDLVDLTVGFLFGEGWLSSPEGIKIEESEEKVEVYGPEPDPMIPRLYGRRLIASACGQGSGFHRLLDTLLVNEIKSNLVLETEIVYRLIRQLGQLGDVFKQTGGTHICALAESKGIVLCREDIGRHNAVDKVLGRCFLEGIDLNDKFLLVSGRISSDLVFKAARSKIPMVISRSAPTDLAINLAERLGITLIGFARGTRFNIYTHKDRIT